MLPWRRLSQRFRWAVPYAPALLVCGVLGYKAISAILARTGHPAVPLDDAFIHFQYARNLAAGRFFTYSPGDGYTPGATSLVWPAVLALFHLLGLHDLSIIWAAWVLGFAAHAALVVETYRLAQGLSGKPVALGAAAMSACFGGMVWFAGSGMETVPLAWIVARTARVAAEWCEAAPAARTARLRREVALLGFFAPLVRPEGALASLMAVAALGACAMPAPRDRSLLLALRDRAFALVPVAGVLLVPVLNLLLTGRAATNTSLVKWLPMSPYYPSLAALWGPVRQNLSLLFSTLLAGEQWSAIFVPKGATPWAIAALVAIPVAGWRARRPWRAAFVLLFALGILLPCTYMSFLWNRLRYLWPFAPGWFVGVACLARLAGEVAASVRPRWIGIAPVLSGAAAGVLATFLPWCIDDLAQSASAIDRQQVALGRWAAANLPQDAIVGLNDTGAIAYLSGRRTFDVVGLTTEGEACYWVAGAGSRFEHYERLAETNPARFPTHFIVYPQWMACEPVLGLSIHEAAVYDQSILGGTRMIVYPARLDLLGSGRRPVQVALAGRLVDELDVADLESELEHRYEVAGGSNELSNRTYAGVQGGDGERVVGWADGGRFERQVDRFEAHLPAGVAVRGVARLVAPQGSAVSVVVKAEGTEVGAARIPASEAREIELTVPAALARASTRIEIEARGGASFGSLHYWFETAP